MAGGDSKPPGRPQVRHWIVETQKVVKRLYPAEIKIRGDDRPNGLAACQNRWKVGEKKPPTGCPTVQPARRDRSSLHRTLARRFRTPHLSGSSPAVTNDRPSVKPNGSCRTPSLCQTPVDWRLAIRATVRENNSFNISSRRTDSPRAEFPVLCRNDRWL